MREISKLHPRLQTKITEFQEKCKAHRLKIGIGECLRTAAEQDALYAQGRTKPGKKVTNSRGSSYSSMHQWGVAFDIYRADGKGAYYDKDGFFAKAGAIGESIGLEWGGHWRSIVDTPHFQLPDWGSTPARLKKIYGRPAAFFAAWEAIPDLKEPNDIAYRLAVEGIAASSEYWIGRMQTEPNVWALCRKIANYTLTHTKGAGEANFKTPNDVIYRLQKAGILTESDYWKQKMEQDVNLFALGRKAAQWML